MLRYLLPLLLTSLLWANTLSTSQKVVLLNHPFTVESNNSIFDTNTQYTHQALLSCQPNIQAVYKIESETKLKVIPKKPLQSGTDYECSYKKEPLNFSTEALGLVDDHFFKRNRLVRLTFNDAIDAKKAKAHIQLTKKDKLSTTNLSYTLSSHKTTLLLQINEPIGNSAVELTINTPLLSETFHKSFNTKERPSVVLDNEKEPMTLSDAPQIVALSSGEFALRLFLNDTLEGTPKEFIAIEGIENFRLNKDNYINHTTRTKMKLSDDAYYYTDVISSEFKPNNTYQVTLKKGLQTYRELKEDKAYKVQSKDRAKTVFFHDEKPYISRVGELGFSSVNIDSATLIVERILDDNLRYFMNFIASKQEEVPNYTQELYSKEITLNNQKNVITKQKFLLKDIAKSMPQGVYQITLRYSENEEEKSQSKVVFLSDLGISVNLSKNQAFITVLSLKNAKPIGFFATVELYGANNELIGTSRTNKDGVAIINKKGLLGKNPKGVIVKTKNDQNFLALNQTIASPTPNQIQEKSERFKGHIYFQSNIVRPASKINALITIKDKDFISASKIPIDVVLKEQYGETLQKKIYHTDGYGLINFNHQLDVEDRTGTYQLQVSIGDTIIGEKSIKVEAFMPPKIENQINTNQEFYQVGQLIEANISSNYLFGAPASGLTGKITLDTIPVNLNHPKYQNYHFVNEEVSKSNTQTYLEYREEIRLNQKGKLNIAIPTNLEQRVPSILEAMIGVTIMDDAQPVSNYKKVMLYPYKNMVGLKLKATHLEQGKEITGEAILIDPISGELIKRTLYAVIKKIDWHYNYSGGTYNWEQETSIVENFTLTSNQQFSKKMNQNGDYVIEIHDRLGGHSSSQEFDIWSWSYSNISPKDDLKSIEIKIEDKLYKKGDTLEATIKSPILEGQLLLTLEGERIESYKMVELKKGVAKVTMSIDNEMKQGLYLHATAFRASDTPSQLIPFRAVGYTFIKPNRNAHKINITLNSPKTSKSKSHFKLNIATDKPSKLLISVVDRGILQLVDQKRPEIFDYFNEKPDKAVSYYDLYDQLMAYISEGKLISFGAGDILSKKKKHLAPDLGKRIKPFMIWSGIVESKENNTSIGIDIPEFNGRASVIVIAINEDSIGVEEMELTVKDDIMIKPSYPRYALVGDKIEVPVRIFNTTKEPKTITLNSKLSENLEFNLTTEQITVPANSSKLLQAKLLATKIGKGSISIYAQYNKESISNSVELPIYSPHAISTKTFKGISNQKIVINVPKAYQGAKAFVTLSTNFIGALRNDLNYLVSYPYGCAEQTSSQISAMHYAKAFLKNDMIVGESENFIRQGVKKLRNMQNYYGEFNYWKEGNHVNSYASLYASQTILELKRDGTEIEERFIKKIIKMLKSVVNADSNYNGTYNEFHRIYAGYILAEDKNLEESSANMLFEKEIYKKHFLAKYYMSAILKMQGKDDEAKKLYDSMGYTLEMYGKRAYGDYTGNFESNQRDMFLQFIIKSQYFNKEAKDLVTIQKSLDNLYSTQERAIALKAISLFLGKPTKSQLDVTLEINGKEEKHTKPITLMFKELTNNTITLNPQSGAMSYSVELIKHLKKPIKNTLSTKKELSIMREFIDEQNNTVDLNTLAQGDKIYSKVTIANYGTIHNVVMSQRIPACLSIVNSRIKNQTANEKFKNKNINQTYKEIRDDRVLNFINLNKKESYNKKTKRYTLKENRGIIYTPLMATTKGECQVPAVIIEAMYDSRIADYAKGVKKIVVKAQGSKPTPLLENRAKDFVQKLYQKEMTSTNPNEFTKLFHYPLTTYYRTKNATKADVLKDKADYFKKWSHRLYSNVKLTVEHIDKKHQEVSVKIVFDYLIKNSQKELTGIRQHIVTVREIGGELFVVRIGLGE